MTRLLIIGAGGVGNVAVRKAAASGHFDAVFHASRTKAKCDAIAEDLKAAGSPIVPETFAVDADNVAELAALMGTIKPDLVVNVALPYQDLTIMDACLQCGVHYLDTANYEPPETAKFEYKWQWDYQERFEQAGLTAILGCGFDPGQTNIYTAYIQKHYLPEIHYLDILDANAGDHGYPFATNFNPEINIREITANGRYWEAGKWIETDPLSVHQTYTFPHPEVGDREIYLMYHEELESLTRNINGIKRARFFMTFSQNYLTHLRVLENVGMTSIEPIDYEGQSVVPLKFLQKVLPDPASLGPRTKGKTCIGCICEGIDADGNAKRYFIYNVCDHQECYREVKSQAISYTTAVPAIVGAEMFALGKWRKPGVWNVEQLDPDPFMERIGPSGLPWQVIELADSATVSV